MRTFKIVLAMVIVLVALTGCKTGGGGGGGSDDNTPQRVFDISDHELLVGEKECYLTHVDSGWSIADTVAACGYYIGADDEVMDYEHVYGSAYYTTNDHANTRYITIEIWDQNHTLVNSGKFEYIENGQPIDFTIIPLYITWLEPEDAGKTFTVDAWLTDTAGVDSSVYTFDITAIQ